MVDWYRTIKDGRVGKDGKKGKYDLEGDEPMSNVTISRKRLALPAKARLLVLVLGIVMIATYSLQAAGEKVELTYLHAFAHWNTPLEQQIVDEFNRTHPNIHVTMEAVTWNKALEVTLVRTAAGVSPDIVSTSPTDFFGFAGYQNLFLNLTDWIKARPDNFKDIPPPVWETVSLNGNIYAIPQRLSTQVFFINHELFAQAGLSRPPYDWLDKSWNWDTLRQYCQRLSVDRDGDGKNDVFGLQNVVPTRFGSFVRQAGTDQVSADYSDYTLDSPEGVMAAEYMRDLIASGYVGGNFTRSTAAIYMAPPTEVSGFAQDFPWDIAPLAQGPAGPATTLGPIAVGIPKAGKHIEEALIFLEYYRSHAVAIQENRGGIFPQPFTTVLMSKENYPPGMTTEQAYVIMQALEVGVPHRDNHPNAAEIKNVIHEAWTSSIVKGEKAPRVALEEIRPKILQLLRGE